MASLGPTQRPVSCIPVFLPGDKASEALSSLALPSYVDVKKDWRYTCTPRKSLYGVNKKNFTFDLLLLLLFCLQ